MNDLIDKLQDLNRLDPLFKYSIQIMNSGYFVLHGISPTDDKHILCEDAQKLREEMYRIVLSKKQ